MKILFSSLMLLLLSAPVLAQVAATTQPNVAVDVTTEEGKKMLCATVTLDGKPLENVKVSIGLRRTFGILSLGEDTTLDDGTATVAFPEKAPGGADGTLQVVAEIKAPASYAGVHGEATVGGGAIVVPEQDPFPRALWSPHAPLALVLPIFILLGGVWITYAFVISQIIAIRKEGRGS
jgi:hypothetical protein